MLPAGVSLEANRLVVSGDPGCQQARRSSQRAIGFFCHPTASVGSTHLTKDVSYGYLEPVFSPRGVGFRRPGEQFGAGGQPSVFGRRHYGRLQHDDIILVNGLGGGRRLASPVRLTLADQLGEDIDGAWWPHTSYVARELPELIEALHVPLGEIVDIKINWSSTDGSPDLDSVQFNAASGLPAQQTKRQHLMMLTGRRAHANLLIVPCLTTTSLAVMLLRRAAAMPISADQQDTKAFRIADFIIGVARAESASCATRESKSSRAARPGARSAARR